MHTGRRTSITWATYARMIRQSSLVPIQCCDHASSSQVKIEIVSFFPRLLLSQFLLFVIVLLLQVQLNSPWRISSFVMIIYIPLYKSCYFTFSLYLCIVIVFPYDCNQPHLFLGGFVRYCIPPLVIIPELHRTFSPSTALNLRNKK